MLKAISGLIDRFFGFLFFPLKKKKPYATRVLRTPGSWSRNQMVLLVAETVWLSGCIIGFLAGIIICLLITGFFRLDTLSILLAIMVVASLVLTGFLTRKRFFKIRDHQIGYYGELRVAEILERLGRPDWHVFHGFRPADKFGKKRGDIDHIVVCPYGVFCVETKAFRKLPDERKNKLIHTPGKPAGALHYSSGREIPYNPLPNFEKKTRDLHEQLKRECGGHGFVARIVVFPEWEVERTGAEKWEFVCSKPNEIKEFIKRSANQLDSEQIKKIADFFDRELREHIEELHYSPAR